MLAAEVVSSFRTKIEECGKLSLPPNKYIFIGNTPFLCSKLFATRAQFLQRLDGLVLFKLFIGYKKSNSAILNQTDSISMNFMKVQLSNCILYIKTHSPRFSADHRKMTALPLLPRLLLIHVKVDFKMAQKSFKISYDFFRTK